MLEEEMHHGGEGTWGRPQESSEMWTEGMGRRRNDPGEGRQWGPHVASCGRSRPPPWPGAALCPPHLPWTTGRQPDEHQPSLRPPLNTSQLQPPFPLCLLVPCSPAISPVSPRGPRDPGGQGLSSLFVPSLELSAWDTSPRTWIAGCLREWRRMTWRDTELLGGHPPAHLLHSPSSPCLLKNGSVDSPREWAPPEGVRDMSTGQPSLPCSSEVPWGFLSQLGLSGPCLFQPHPSFSCRFCSRTSELSTQHDMGFLPFSTGLGDKPCDVMAVAPQSTESNSLGAQPSQTPLLGALPTLFLIFWITGISSLALAVWALSEKGASGAGRPELGLKSRSPRQLKKARQGGTRSFLECLARRASWGSRGKESTVGGPRALRIYPVVKESHSEFSAEETHG